MQWHVDVSSTSCIVLVFTPDEKQRSQFTSGIFSSNSFFFFFFLLLCRELSPNLVTLFQRQIKQIICLINQITHQLVFNSYVSCNCQMQQNLRRLRMILQDSKIQNVFLVWVKSQNSLIQPRLQKKYCSLWSFFIPPCSSVSPFIL